MEFLTVKKLCKVYGRDESQVTALDHVSLTIEKGEFTAIIGSSGSGKSTLLHCIAGVDIPTRGKIYLDGQDIYAQNNEKLAIFRRRQVGLIYQFHNLIPTLNVVENITLPILHRFINHLRVDRDKEEEIIDNGMKSLRVKAPSAQVNCSTLSGGNQQKVILAREIIRDHNLLIAVQPTRGLDVGAIEFVHKQLVKERDEGKAVLLVSLELDEVMEVSDRILVMHDGEIMANVRPENVTVQKLGLYMSGAEREEAV